MTTVMEFMHRSFGGRQRVGTFAKEPRAHRKPRNNVIKQIKLGDLGRGSREENILGLPFNRHDGPTTRTAPRSVLLIVRLWKSLLGEYQMIAEQFISAIKLIRVSPIRRKPSGTDLKGLARTTATFPIDRTPQGYRHHMYKQCHIASIACYHYWTNSSTVILE